MALALPALARAARMQPFHRRVADRLDQWLRAGRLWSWSAGQAMTA